MQRWWSRWRSMDPVARSGVLVCSVLTVTIAAWIASVGWLAAFGVLVILGIAANVVGVDSRMPGDWRARIRAR